MKAGIFRAVICLSLVLIFSGFKTLPNNEIAYRLIVFEGSDWCSNCRRLEKEILAKDDFMQFLKLHNIELERIDFPQRKKLSEEQKKYNASMAEKYAFGGVYPTLFLSRTDTFKYEKVFYKTQSVDEFTSQIAQKIEQLK
jgi:thiol-disulfide isomerase/thioredoxin